MPTLGSDMEDGTLVEWLKRPGERVKHGDIIAIVDTEKGAIEIEVFEDGMLETIAVEPGEKVPVGTVLAIIRGSGAEKTTIEATPGPRPASIVAPPVLTSTTQPPLPAPPETARRLRASPLARRRASELGVDLGTVRGTGSQGAVTREDVERAGSGDRAGSGRGAHPSRHACRHCCGDDPIEARDPPLLPLDGHRHEHGDLVAARPERAAPDN
jgi:pyruvate dehydrogenase E2 component (dihydrolipoamide acetyltransferase)